MLTLIIPKNDELFDEEKQEFITRKEKSLTLEHSLVSISKWESRWMIPFLSNTPKTEEQALDYTRCMIVTKNIDPDIIHQLSNDDLIKIKDYIKSTMSATTVKKNTGKVNKDVVTSEILYYQMVAHNIPFECERWHLNRLLMLITVCNEKNAPAKKSSKHDTATRNKSINSARRKSMGTKG
jgi:hypothetical protein